MAVFTLVLAGTSLGGIWISYETLKEIQSSASQTDQTVKTLRSQADSLAGQLGELKESNGTAKAALLAGSRAWIGVQSASSVPPAADTDLIVTIPYLNTGKLPAINLSYHAEPFVFTRRALARASVPMSDFIQHCIAGKKYAQGVAYPTNGFTTYSLTVKIAKERITKDVIERGDTLVVAGCFTYETFNMTRYSSFCMYFTPKESKPESWNFCNVGNNAD
jgi:hypothetical protein